jgi:2-oxoisovalerate dehydrogenase E1 component alpha subunit
MSSSPAADVRPGERNMSDPERQPVATSNGHSVHIERVRLMLLARALEQRAIALGARNGAAGTRMVHVRGSEAFGVGSASALQPGDRLFASNCYLSAHLARGLEPGDFLARCLGRRGHSVGEPGSAGWASRGTGLVDLAAGAALALRLRDGDGLVSMVLVPGEAYASGQCDQALRAARSRELALVLMVEAPEELQVSGPALEVSDAADVDAVFNGAVAAVASARAGDGPQTVMCRRPRVAAGAPAAIGDADPVTRALHRLASNPEAHGLFGPLRRDVVAAVRAAANGTGP